MPSDEFAKVWKDPIDLLFIDGDHSKKQVLKDVDNIGKYVREGTGIILLHDTYPIDKKLLSESHCDSAWEAAAEIRRGYRRFQYEIMTFPGPWAGLSIMRKCSIDKHLFWYEEGETIRDD